MSLTLNKPKLDNLAGDIWKSAERLRGKFKAYEYQSVILPIIVIRRLECVLLAWREAKSAEVLAKRPKLTEKELAKLVKELELNPQQSPFSNKTDWTLRKVYEEDHTLLEENFRAYINGFSKNVDDIIEHFNYRATIGTMVKNNRLAPILNQYKELELGPDQLSGLEMGYIYEELLRRFSEQSGEEAGDHFTPREVIRLMVELLEIPIPDRHISIYDPACGTGGMLSVAKEHLLDRAATPAQTRQRREVRHRPRPGAFPDQLRHLPGRPAHQERPAGQGLPRQLAHPPRPAQQGAGRPASRNQIPLRLHAQQSALRRHLGRQGRLREGGAEAGEDPLPGRHAARERRRAAVPANHAGQDASRRRRAAAASPSSSTARRSPMATAARARAKSAAGFWRTTGSTPSSCCPTSFSTTPASSPTSGCCETRSPPAHRGRVMLIDARQQFEKEPKSFGNKRNRMTDAHRQWIEERYQQGLETRL